MVAAGEGGGMRGSWPGGPQEQPFLYLSCPLSERTQLSLAASPPAPHPPADHPLLLPTVWLLLAAVRQPGVPGGGLGAGALLRRLLQACAADEQHDARGGGAGGQGGGGRGVGLMRGCEGGCKRISLPSVCAVLVPPEPTSSPPPLPLPILLFTIPAAVVSSPPAPSPAAAAARLNRGRRERREADDQSAAARHLGHRRHWRPQH